MKNNQNYLDVAVEAALLAGVIHATVSIMPQMPCIPFDKQCYLVRYT